MIKKILLFIEQIKKLSQYQYFFLKFDIIAIPLFKKLLECFSSPHFLVIYNDYCKKLNNFFRLFRKVYIYLIIHLLNWLL